MSRWPMVSLGEVLTKSEEWIQIHADQRYKEVTVRLWGNGAVLRRQVLGAEIAASSRLQVHADQFIISRIDARNGASGLIPQELDGAVVTNDFPVFKPNPNKLQPKYLRWLSKTQRFIELCKAASEGTTNRVRLKEDRFLATQIPLPPVREQRRLIERIDALAAKVEEARQLRQEADHAAEALMPSHTLNIFEELAKNHLIRKFAEFEPHVTSGPRNWGQRTVDLGDRFYRAQDVLPKGRLATSGKVFIESSDTSQGTGAKLKPGDLMIVITGATVGRVAVYPADSEPGYVSQHVAICRIDPARLNPSFALQGLLSPYGQQQILGQRYGQGKPGLNLTNIRNLRLPVPPLPVQERVVEYLDRLEERVQQLTSQQTGSSEELDAILPAILDRGFRGEL